MEQKTEAFIAAKKRRGFLCAHLLVSGVYVGKRESVCGASSSDTRRRRKSKQKILTSNMASLRLRYPPCDV